MTSSDLSLKKSLINCILFINHWFIQKLLIDLFYSNLQNIAHNVKFNMILWNLEASELITNRRTPKGVGHTSKRRYDHYLQYEMTGLSPTQFPTFIRWIFMSYFYGKRIYLLISPGNVCILLEYIHQSKEKYVWS